MEVNTEQFYMRRAIELAKKGIGWTNPNPMVGAVIEKNGHIIGEGCHEKYGELHAERNALKNCREVLAAQNKNSETELKGASMYVTLEPCCHYGKQPPCTDAIIESGIKKVFIGSRDPNPLVAGKGIQILRNHGIEVITDVIKEECDAVNEIFFHFIKTGRPLVIMKYAMTIDGKIAAYTGKSQWITGREARKHVHCQRNRYAAIMTGIGTVLADNPMLTCRLDGEGEDKGHIAGNNPTRIICDTNLRIPLDCNIVKTASYVKTIIATSGDNKEKTEQLENAGCQVINVGYENNDTIENQRLNLNNLISHLGKMKIDSIYLEGGQMLSWSALNSGIVDKVNAYISPKIFGGNKGFTPVGGNGVDKPDDAFLLDNTKFIRLGNDYMLEGDVVKNVYRNY